MAESSDPPTVLLGRFTRRPAVAVALLLALGIFLHDRVAPHPNRFLLLSAIVALLPELFAGRPRFASLWLCLLVVLLGIGLGQREHYRFAKDDIGQFAGDEPRLSELRLQLIDDPQIVASSVNEQRILPPKQVAVALVSSIKTWSGWVPASGQMPIQIDQIQPSLAAGQTVQVLGMLQRPRSAMNPGEFDWAAYYRQQRIRATLTVSRAGNIHILSNPGPSLIAWLRERTRHALSDGFSAAVSTDSALLDALLLGDRDPQLRQIQQQFQSTGTAYQLSVSGLHIVILGAAVLWLCRFFLFGPRLTLGITTAFVLVYSIIALPSHSGIRAAILCLVGAVAFCSSRSFDRLQLISLAAIGMLLWHPLDLFSIGFHLSFAVVIVFVLLLPPLREWVHSWRDPHVAVAPVGQSKSRLKSLGDRALAWAIRGLEYSLLAWLATLPLVAYDFGQASSWSIASGLILLPVVIVALFGGMLKMVMTFLLPRWAAVFVVPAGWPLQCLQFLVHQLARLPGASIALPAPPIWLIVLYYVLLLATLLPFRHRWLLRLMPVVGVGLILGLAFHTPQAIAAPDQLKMTLLSLGAGQCAVVEIPGGNTVLFDAGSTTVSDVAEKIVEPFLRSEGRSQVEDIFLSHGDFDHISAAGEIAETMGVQQVFTSCHFIKNSAGNVPDQLLLEDLQKLNRTPKQIAVGDHLDLGHGAEVQVLWPPRTGDLNSNNAGLVLRLTYAGRSILFPADIQDPAFSGVLANAKALQSDVLVAPHHGSSENLTPAFLAAVHPQVILSSNFARLTSKQREFETMVGQTPLYRTPQCGAITVVIHPDGKLDLQSFVRNSLMR
jgi:competence protein ComEC